MLNTKIRIILLFSIALYLFLINTHFTDADLFAERMVQRNVFSMTTLDFAVKNSVNNGSIVSLFHTVGLQPGGYDLGAIKIKNAGKLGFKYHIKAVKMSGDDALCNSLEVQVMQRNLTSKYQGKLLGLNIDSSLQNTSPEDWIFFVSLNETTQSLQGKICEFSIGFKTWRDQPDEKKGIFAERIITNVITTGNW